MKYEQDSDRNPCLRQASCLHRNTHPWFDHVPSWQSIHQITDPMYIPVRYLMRPTCGTKIWFGPKTRPVPDFELPIKSGIGQDFSQNSFGWGSGPPTYYQGSSFTPHVRSSIMGRRRLPDSSWLHSEPQMPDLFTPKVFVEPVVALVYKLAPECVLASPR